jgi:hypothetical protein
MTRTPREDKDRDFKRQSVSGAQHGLRNKWNQTKARAHRRYRRAESTALAQAGSLADDRVADDVQARLATTRRRVDNRYGPPSLADHVTERLTERFLDMVDTFSAGPYRPETQGDRTEKALTEILRDRRGGRRGVFLTRTAIDLDALLPDPVFPGRGRWRRTDRTDRRREWFTAFLDDRPGWEVRLVRWIADRSPM